MQRWLRAYGSSVWLRRLSRTIDLSRRGSPVGYHLAQRRRPWILARFSFRSSSKCRRTPHDSSCRWPSPCNQLGEVVVDARHTEIRLATEGVMEIVDAVRVAIEEFHDGQDEVVRFVERVED